MSDRMKRIKAKLKAQKARQREQGGHWERRGECARCGACCNILTVAPEEYEKVEKEARDGGRIREGQRLDVTRTEEELEEAWERLRAVAAEIEAARVFPPRVGKTCRWCSVKRWCQRQHED